MPSRKIEVLYRAALFILHEARNLFEAGTGQDIYENDVSGAPGLIDGVPIDSETYRWAQATMNFCRYVAQVMLAGIRENNENLLLGNQPDMNALIRALETIEEQSNA